MLGTAWLLEVDVIAYWQYGMGGGWVRYRHSPQSSGRGGTFLCHVIQGGPGYTRAFHCEPLPDFPEPELEKITKIE